MTIDMFHGAMKKTRLASAIIALIALNNMLSTQPLDHSAITGKMKSVGFDGALDVVQNPAYLANQISDETVNIATNGRLIYYLGLQNPIFETLNPKGVILWNASIAITFHNMLRNRFHFGLYFDNKTTKDYADQDFYQSFTAITPKNINILTNNYHFLSDEKKYNVALAMALKFGASNSIGLTAYYSNNKKSLVRDFTIDYDAGGAPGTIKHKEDFSTTIHNYHISLGLLNTSDFGEISLTFYPFGQSIQSNTRDISYDHSILGSSIYNIAKTDSFNDNNLDPLSFSAGFSQVFMSHWKIFLESSVILRKTYVYRTLELDYTKSSTFPSAITFEVSELIDYSPSVSIGLLLKIPNIMNIHSGGGLHLYRKYLTYTNTKVFTDSIVRYEEIIEWFAQLGFSRSFSDKLHLSLGVEYFQLRGDITESEYISGQNQENTYVREYKKLNINASMTVAF